MKDVDVHTVVPLMLVTTLFQIQKGQRYRDYASKIAGLLTEVYPIETDGAVKAPNPGTRHRVEFRLTIPTQSFQPLRAYGPNPPVAELGAIRDLVN